MFNSVQSAARAEYTAGFSGTPWITWGLFFLFAVSMVVFTLAVDQWVTRRI